MLSRVVAGVLSHLALPSLWSLNVLWFWFSGCLRLLYPFLPISPFSLAQENPWIFPMRPLNKRNPLISLFPPRWPTHLPPRGLLHHRVEPLEGEAGSQTNWPRPPGYQIGPPGPILALTPWLSSLKVDGESSTRCAERPVGSQQLRRRFCLGHEPVASLFSWSRRPQFPFLPAHKSFFPLCYHRRRIKSHRTEK